MQLYFLQSKISSLFKRDNWFLQIWILLLTEQIIVSGLKLFLDRYKLEKLLYIQVRQDQAV